ncbi:MAG: recombinase family protein [Clostridium sp.]|jgi:DNA invertase Pin-like site-specific DNA recombinase|nr:recombinase family protein [Clostridium sp.]
MARTSRYGEPVIRSEPAETVYRTAIYVRLSVWNADKDSGNSIENQEALLRRYLADKPCFALRAVYADNGETGTDFDRPGFARMMEEARAGRINCIVVKDLSRFGRNYIETGNYLETVLPRLGVRFLSVQDQYDSLDATVNEALILSLKNVCHHFYAKDISRKICTLLEVKKKQGLFLGKAAPYGYQKSAEDPYRLSAEEGTAPVVREIFSLRMRGAGVGRIARQLNDRGIPSPHRRLYELGLLRGTNGERDALWSASSVLGILENPVYCGCLIERKSETAYYKGAGKRVLSKKEWNYLENTHEAIVDKGIFEEVRRLIEAGRQSASERRKKNRKRTENILKGLVYCGICQSRMSRDGGYYDQEGRLIRHRYGCRRKYAGAAGCAASSIVEAQLLLAVSESLKAQFLLAAEEIRELRNDQRGFQGIAAPDTGWIEDVLRLQDAGSPPQGLCARLIQKIVVFHDRITVHYTYRPGFGRILDK